MRNKHIIESILLRLQKYPCDSMFYKFMLKSYDQWKLLSRREWLELLKDILSLRACALYDFLQFIHNLIGVDIYNEFFFRMKFSKEDIEYLDSTINPDKHSALKSEFTINEIIFIEVMKIRKHFYKLGLVLKNAEYIHIDTPVGVELIISHEIEGYYNNFNKILEKR